MGPLAGYRILELAGIGPGPMCAMLLADMGATVLRLDRRVAADDLGIVRPERFHVINRGRRSAAIDLKPPDGVALVLDTVGRADALVAGFRPGTMARLVLGPRPFPQRTPRSASRPTTGQAHF